MFYTNFSLYNFVDPKVLYQGSSKDWLYFVLHNKIKWSDMEFLLKKDGILFNFIDESNQLKKDDVPWTGACEKHTTFFGIIIYTLTNEGNIVMDWQCGTGLLLHLCLPTLDFPFHYVHYSQSSLLLTTSLLFLSSASIIACRLLGHHIVALEHMEIFNALLLPMQDLEPPSRPAITQQVPSFHEPP